jgi:hypothetical protein
MEQLHLKTNMRVLNPDLSTEEKNAATEFANWLLQVGEGRLETTADDYITLPNYMLLPPGKHNLPTLFNALYQTISEPRNEDQGCDYFSQRAILAPLNKDVDALNDKILEMFPGQPQAFLSADDAVDPTGSGTATEASSYPTEFLNSISLNGMPLHNLTLKIGVPIMLLRNLDPAAGLCNGTRLIISNMSRRVLEGIIITGPHTGQRCFIPRIPLTSPPSARLPFQLRRLQFPVRVAFTMSINKSQGQSLDDVGLYLITPIFAHGQLYVALSRAKHRHRIHVLLDDSETGLKGQTKNIVYPEVLF